MAIRAANLTHQDIVAKLARRGQQLSQGGLSGIVRGKQKRVKKSLRAALEAVLHSPAFEGRSWLGGEHYVTRADVEAVAPGLEYASSYVYSVLASAATEWLLFLEIPDTSRNLVIMAGKLWDVMVRWPQTLPDSDENRGPLTAALIAANAQDGWMHYGAPMLQAMAIGARRDVLVSRPAATPAARTTSAQPRRKPKK